MRAAATAWACLLLASCASTQGAVTADGKSIACSRGDWIGHRLRVTLTFSDPQRRETPPPVAILTGATPSALTLPLTPVN